MDGMNINGKWFAFNKSRIAGMTFGKLVAALDTGFSLPPLHPGAVDTIYSIQIAPFLAPCFPLSRSSDLFHVTREQLKYLSLVFG